MSALSKTPDDALQPVAETAYPTTHEGEQEISHSAAAVSVATSMGVRSILQEADPDQERAAREAEGDTALANDHTSLAFQKYIEAKAPRDKFAAVGKQFEEGRRYRDAIAAYEAGGCILEAESLGLSLINQGKYELGVDALSLTSEQNILLYSLAERFAKSIQTHDLRLRIRIYAKLNEPEEVAKLREQCRRMGMGNLVRFADEEVARVKARWARLAS